MDANVNSLEKGFTNLTWILCKMMGLSYRFSSFFFSSNGLIKQMFIQSKLQQHNKHTTVAAYLSAFAKLDTAVYALNASKGSADLGEDNSALIIHIWTSLDEAHATTAIHHPATAVGSSLEQHLSCFRWLCLLGSWRNILSGGGQVAEANA